MKKQLWGCIVLCVLFYSQSFATSSSPSPAMLAPLPPSVSTATPSNPSSHESPSNPSVALSTYYPDVYGRAGSTDVVSFLMLLPIFNVPIASIFHIANCSLACCTLAETKALSAYQMFLTSNPDSIAPSFIGHNSDVHFFGIPPTPSYIPGTGTHTGANCFFFCNRYAVLKDGLHDTGFINKFMHYFGPQDPAQIGSDAHRKAIRLLAAVLNLRSPDVLDNKNTILHRYLMLPYNLFYQVKTKIASLTAPFLSIDNQKIFSVVIEELKRYHCKVTLQQNDPDYTTLGCAALLAQ